jgi:hypothetical protein
VFTAGGRRKNSLHELSIFYGRCGASKMKFPFSNNCTACQCCFEPSSISTSAPSHPSCQNKAVKSLPSVASIFQSSVVFLPPPPATISMMNFKALPLPLPCFIISQHVQRLTLLTALCKSVFPQLSDIAPFPHSFSHRAISQTHKFRLPPFFVLKRHCYQILCFTSSSIPL